MAEPGNQFIFTGYGIEPPDGVAVFEPGDLGVIAAVDDDDAYKCFGLDWRGRAIAMKGDTLFRDEIIPLLYAPKLPVGAIFE